MTKNKISPYKVDKNIPIPPKTKEFWKVKQNSYPFKYMEAGDSFLADENYSRELMTKYANAARGWMRYAKYNAWKFSARKTDEGIRIWRIK